MYRKILPCIFIFALLFAPASFAAEPATASMHKASVYTKVTDWYGEHLNYGTITLLMAVESSFIPFPSEVVVPPAAYKALQPGSGMSVILVVLFATLGALIGAFVNYYLAKLLGRPIIYKFADSRIGRLCLLTPEGLEKAEAFFRDHGAVSTFVGRLIPAIRQLISIPAGIADMNLGVFTLFTALGAAFWNTILAILGYFALGQMDLIEKYNGELSIVLYILGAMFIAYMIRAAFKKKKQHE